MAKTAPATSGYDLGGEPTVRPKKAKQLAQKEKMKQQAGTVATVNDAYKKLRDSKNPAFADLQSKLTAFIAYHTKIAKDRVGMENRKEVVDGKIVEVPQQVKLSNSERITELDRAAGIEEIQEYIARRLV